MGVVARCRSEEVAIRRKVQAVYGACVPGKQGTLAPQLHIPHANRAIGRARRGQLPVGMEGKRRVDHASAVVARMSGRRYTQEARARVERIEGPRAIPARAANKRVGRVDIDARDLGFGALQYM